MAPLGVFKIEEPYQGAVESFINTMNKMLMETWFCNHGNLTLINSNDTPQTLHIYSFVIYLESL